MDLKIQSQTEAADGRAEREFYSRGAEGEPEREKAL